MEWDDFFTTVERYAVALSRDLAREFRQDPDDAYQTFVVQLWTRFHGYDPKRSAPTTWTHWQYRAARSRYAASRRSLPAVSFHGAAEFDVVDRRAADPLDVLEAADDAVALRAALAKLDARQRRVVMVRSGMEDGPGTLPELGVEFGVTKTMIGDVEARALRRLAGMLGADPERCSSLAKV